MKINVFLVFVIIFLVCSISPTTAMETGEFQKSIETIAKGNNLSNLKNLSYLERIKTCFKLPELIKETYKLGKEGEEEILEFQRHETEQKDIKYRMNTFLPKKGV